MKNKYFFAVCIFLILTGCVSVSIRSNVNKDYLKRRYNNIVVISTSEDSDYADNAENQVLKYIELYQDDWVNCLKFSSDYYAGSNTNSEVFKNKLTQFIKKNDADGVLFISDNGIGEKGVVTGMTATSYGFSVNRATVRTVGVVMELFDAKTRESVWYSRGSSATSSILASDEGLMNSFVMESMNRLAKTGLLDQK